MTRGNQRDIDRARALKRNEKGKLKGGAASGEDVAVRMEKNADIMREKQRLANERKLAEGK